MTMEGGGGRRKFVQWTDERRVRDAMKTGGGISCGGVVRGVLDVHNDILQVGGEVEGRSARYTRQMPRTKGT